jgi:CheY-like chemotaxis protein
MESGKRLGKLLVEAGIISVTTLDRTLEMQKGSGMRLGTLLMKIGIVTDEEVIDALCQQCNLKKVSNIADQTFPKELLDLVPAQMALENLIFPLKQNERMLAIATLDPYDQDTFDQLADITGMKIFTALATREEILASVKKHYGKEEKLKSDRHKILLIDDSPVFLKILDNALDKEGYEVLMAADGVEGLQRAISSHPDLILCDLLLPRMDGYKFQMALKAHYETEDIPVILITSKASMEEENRALKAGFIDFIGKPVMPARLIARIERALLMVQNMHQTLMRNPNGANLHPAASGSKAACRSYSQRRDEVSKLERQRRDQKAVNAYDA